MSRNVPNGNKHESTFHVPLTLVHDKGIPPTTVFLVSDNPYPFNGTKGLKFAP